MNCFTEKFISHFYLVNTPVLVNSDYLLERLSGVYNLIFFVNYARACAIPYIYLTHTKTSGQSVSAAFVETQCFASHPSSPKSLTHIPKNLTAGYKSLIQPCKSLIQPHKPLTQTYKPLIQPCKTLIQTCKSLIQPYNLLIQTCKPLIQTYKSLIQTYKPLTQPCKSLTYGCGVQALIVEKQAILNNIKTILL
jgi:hypothetical protein